MIFDCTRKSYAPKFVILNRSTFVSDKELDYIAKAAQFQLRQDLASAWYGLGSNASVVCADEWNGKDWPVVIADNESHAKALGWHAENRKTDIPVVTVFARTADNYGFSVSGVVTHETTEAAANSALTLGHWEGGSWQRIREVADPVQAEDLTYTIKIKGHNINVTDFTYPAYYDKNTRKTKFDFRGALSKPGEVAAGGYQPFRTSNGIKNQYGAVPRSVSLADRFKALELV